MVRHCQYNAVDLLWRTDISGSCWITKPSSPWEADWSPTFANLCHLWHLHLYLATYVSGRPEPSSSANFCFLHRAHPRLTNGEKWIANAQHPTPGATYWTQFPDKFKSNMFKADWTRGSARPGLIQLFLKFFRYSCGGIDIGSGIYWNRGKQKLFRQPELPFPIWLNTYPGDHNQTETFYWKDIFRKKRIDCTIVVLCEMTENMRWQQGGWTKMWYS